MGLGSIANKQRDVEKTVCVWIVWERQEKGILNRKEETALLITTGKASYQRETNIVKRYIGPSIPSQRDSDFSLIYQVFIEG